MAAPPGPWPPPTPPGYPPPDPRALPPGPPPLYQPAFGYPPPVLVPVIVPPRKSETGTAVIVVAVLLVLILVVPVAYVLVTGLSGGPAPQPSPHFTLTSGGAWVLSATGADYQFTFANVNDDAGRVDSATLRYLLVQADGTVLFLGTADENVSRNGFIVNIHYTDPFVPGRLNGGDSIRVSVSPSAGNPLVGGRLSVQINSITIASGTM